MATKVVDPGSPIVPGDPEWIVAWIHRITELSGVRRAKQNSLLEGVPIDSPDLVTLLDRDSDTVIDHPFGERFPVDQDDLLSDLADVFPRFG